MSKKDFICLVCKKTCTIDPYIHKGCLRLVRKVGKIKEKLALLSARSAAEMMPAYQFQSSELRQLYFKGARECEKVWHDFIRELQEVLE